MQNGQGDAERRIQALERQLNTLRGALAVVGMAGAAAVGLAGWAVARHMAEEETAAQPAVNLADLRVQRLTVVDEAGQPRAELGLAADGGVALSLRAPDGALRLSLQGHPQRAGLSTFGERDQQRSWTGWSFTEEHGDRAELQLRDRAGQLRLGAVASDGVPGLTLYNETGVTVDAFPR